MEEKKGRAKKTIYKLFKQQVANAFLNSSFEKGVLVQSSASQVLYH
jgi:hypothetical protein